MKNTAKPRTEVDFHKKWTNGHKSFTAAEARALGEILTVERDAQERYDEKKSRMVKSRNPMIGDSTPRNSNGEPILNPRAFDKVHGGLPLFPADLPPAREIKRPPPPVDKIGIQTGRYEVLGNKQFAATNAQPEDLYKLAQATAEMKTLRKTEADKLKECKERAKAQRQMKQLEIEVRLLREASSKREQELSRLRHQYG